MGMGVIVFISVSIRFLIDFMTVPLVLLYTFQSRVCVCGWAVWIWDLNALNERDLNMWLVG